MEKARFEPRSPLSLKSLSLYEALFGQTAIFAAAVKELLDGSKRCWSTHRTKYLVTLCWCQAGGRPPPQPHLHAPAPTILSWC